MADRRDYYAILQVNRNAGDDEIERAYERLSKAYDPETSRKPRAAQRYAEVQEAYDVLSDREKRREYDRDARRGEGAVAGAAVPGDVLTRRFILAAAGTLIASVIAIVAIIIVFGGGGGDELVANPTTPGVTLTPAPTLPQQTPGIPADSPPEITGEEVTLDSGLSYIDFEPGTGAAAAVGDTVAVNYTGWLQDTGERFDTSVDKTEPFRITIGVGRVTQGWDLGLPGILEGGKRRLIIPADLGYGDVGSGSVPPGATLIFDVELVDILVTAPTPVPTPAPTPSLPAQTPGVPADSPPDVTGQEITLDSGLVYIDYAPGTGEIAADGDTVAVNYTGWLQDTGERFDSSVDKPEPFRVTIGAGGVIPGWEQGLPGMAAGGGRRLIIPADLAYGETGFGEVIPPGATLIFDIELVTILEKAPQQ